MSDTSDWARLPKVELHLHLEGAAPPAFIRGLAQEKNVDLSGIFRPDGSYDTGTFDHFLKVYEAACTVLQTPDDFRRLTLANLVEFDCEFGHRRDPAGYRDHLEWFDAELARLLPKLRPGDLFVVTADHGNDPTWTGTDHTRERVPVLAHGLGPRDLGHMAFTDVAVLVADHLGVPRP